MPGPKPGALPLGHIPPKKDHRNYIKLLIRSLPLSVFKTFLVLEPQNDRNYICFRKKFQLELYWCDMKQTVVEAKIEKIVYGGQGLATLKDGKKVFVWGALRGEVARVRLTKSKKNWAEGIAEEIIQKSEKRIDAEDSESYLSTSPWQILNYTYENTLKQELIIDQFAQHNVALQLDDFTAPQEPYHYRNKVEFSFWWEKLPVNSTVLHSKTVQGESDLSDLSTPSEDSTPGDQGQLDLAFFKRGTHTKQPVEGTSLAHPSINTAALKIRDYLRAQNVAARDLKTLLIRCNQQGDVVAELYVKEASFALTPSHEEFGVAGFGIFFSNPKSPASVKTKKLHTSGQGQLTDAILGKSYTYAVDGFFQVTIPLYEAALKAMQAHIDPHAPLVDMYSGVGSIGLSLAKKDQPLKLIEIDERCVFEAKHNAQSIKPDTEVLFASSEAAIEHISGNETVVVDPPRAGLHQNVINRFIEVKPKTIIYLSCNPATQARDVALLQDAYQITHAHGFNFFPRTPHIENLVVLTAQ